MNQVVRETHQAKFTPEAFLFPPVMTIVYAVNYGTQNKLLLRDFES